MRLLHYSSEPLVSVRDVAQDLTDRRSCSKPIGLWLSVQGEDDWPSFCRYNYSHFFAEALHCTEVVLRADARVLTVADRPTLHGLRARYPRAHSIGMDDYFRAPDWVAVSRDYQGIVIAPYHWESRLDHDVSWYYTWDCASGCVWSTDAVDRLIDRPDLLAAARTEVATGTDA